MKLDVFLTMGDWNPTDVRYGMALSTLAYWRAEEDAGRCRLVIYPWAGYHSQRERHVHASLNATTDPYVVADDDMLLRPFAQRDQFKAPRERWNDYVTRVWADRDPSIALVSSPPFPNFSPATFMQADGSRPDILPQSPVGWIRFMQKGVVTDAIPPMDPQHRNPRGYDHILCTWLKGQRRQSGVLPKLPNFHLGWGNSTVLTEQDQYQADAR